MMNKNFIVEYLKSVIGYRSEKKALLMAIESAKAKMEITNCVFENVEDPFLIEVAIFEEQAARKRYEYLINQAKKKNISVNNRYIINKDIRFAE